MAHFGSEERSQIGTDLRICSLQAGCHSARRCCADHCGRRDITTGFCKPQYKHSEHNVPTGTMADMNVMGVINHSVTGSEACSTWSKVPGSGSHGPWELLLLLFLLNRLLSSCLLNIYIYVHGSVLLLDLGLMFLFVIGRS